MLEPPGVVADAPAKEIEKPTIDEVKDAKDLETASETSELDRSTSAGDLSEPGAARVFNVSCPVRTGGATLALSAGIVNAVAFHALSTFVSHTTGTLSKVGLGLQDGERADAGDSMLLLLSFVVGSTVCGLLIAHNTIHFGLALYDVTLLGISCLLLAATATAEHRISRYFACAACGLQNGMATHWGGAVIRTTHVTGLFTDVGLITGRVCSMLLRKRCGLRFDVIDHVECQDDLSKLSVLLTIAFSFLLGIYLGAHLYDGLQERAFLIPAGITGSAGLAYLIYRVFYLHQKFFSDAEMEIVDVPVEAVDLEHVQAMHSIHTNADMPRRMSSSKADLHEPARSVSHKDMHGRSNSNSIQPLVAKVRTSTGSGDLVRTSFSGQLPCLPQGSPSATGRQLGVVAHRQQNQPVVSVTRAQALSGGAAQHGDGHHELHRHYTGALASAPSGHLQHHAPPPESHAPCHSPQPSGVTEPLPPTTGDRGEGSPTPYESTPEIA